MSTRPALSTRPRRPSTGYYLALAAAPIGLVLLTIAVDDARRWGATGWTR